MRRLGRDVMMVEYERATVTECYSLAVTCSGIIYILDQVIRTTTTKNTLQKLK